MVAGRHALGLPILGHDIADVDLQRVGGAHRIGNAVHQQVWDDAGIQASRPQQDQVGLTDRTHRLRQRLGMLGQQAHTLNAAVLSLFEGTDLGLPQHRGAVFKGGLQRHVGIGHRQHPAGDGQHLAHAGHRLVEGIGNAVEGRQDQIPEGLARQVAGARREAVGQQLLHDRLHIGQGLHTVADVPRRGHAKVLAQPAGSASVIRHGDDSGQVLGVVFQAPQHGGKAGAAADGDHTGPPLLPPGLGAFVMFHRCALLMHGSCPGGFPWLDSPSGG